MTPSSPALALLEDLQARGVTLRVVGDKLRYRPAEALTPEDVERLRAVKPEVMKLLAAPPAPARTAGRYAPPWPDEIQGLGRRTVDAFAPCEGPCGTWSWVRYGRAVLCLTCATRGAGR